MIYNLGHACESLYIIKSGRVALDIFFEVERTLSIPVKQKEWEVQRTFQIFRRTILIIGPNNLFGLEEVMAELPLRMIRARVLEDTECLYANKKVFTEYFNQNDRERVKQLIIGYTDFE